MMVGRFTNNLLLFEKCALKFGRWKTQQKNAYKWDDKKLELSYIH